MDDFQPKVSGPARRGFGLSLGVAWSGVPWGRELTAGFSSPEFEIRVRMGLRSLSVLTFAAGLREPPPRPLESLWRRSQGPSCFEMCRSLCIQVYGKIDPYEAIGCVRDTPLSESRRRGSGIEGW